MMERENRIEMSEYDRLVVNSLQYLFHRPMEPLYRLNENVVFILPFNYLSLRHRFQAWTYQIRARLLPDKTLIHVKDVPIPDISIAASLDVKAQFTVYNVYHQDCASQLIDMFTAMVDIQEFLSACVYCRERVNPFLFIYAASIAMLFRGDTRSFAPFPTHVECFPELYLNGCVFQGIRELADVPVHLRVPIEIPRHQQNEFTNDNETRLAYWREDVGLNLMHWNWYMLNPMRGCSNYIDNFRRGEHFLYAHQQILARYNFERLCNGLSRVESLSNLESSIPEGHVSNLYSLVGKRSWPNRMPNSHLKDINRLDNCIGMAIADLERWVLRLYEAIHGTIRVPGIEFKKINVRERDKLNFLGDMIEYNDLNVNKAYYGPLRTTVLMMLGFIHDPDGANGEPNGNICDPATAMRDPLFYRWHATMDTISQVQKSRLLTYSAKSLKSRTQTGDIRILSMSVISTGCVRKNEFQTFWQQSNIDLSKGLDFDSNGPLYARVTHLQHLPFTYQILVDNRTNERTVTVRIFLSPKFDETGRRFSFEEQRSLFIEQDQFAVKLMIGTNVVERHSKHSVSTMLRSEVFPPSGPISAETFENKFYIGWPEYLLIPKGTEEGFPCEMFAIVTKHAYDSTTDGTSIKGDYWRSENKYEDGRSFGFPFDRPAAPAVQTLSQFLTPNMIVIDTCIRFNDSHRHHHHHHPS